MTEAQQGGTRLPTAIEEATSMTATASTATSPEGLLGRVAEAMTGEVVVLEADTRSTWPCAGWSTPRCRGLPSSTTDAWLAW
jgi:hypothetical protein